MATSILCNGQCLGWLAICNIGAPCGNRMVVPAMFSAHLREGLWR